MSFGPPGNEPRILGHWNWGSDVKRPEVCLTGYQPMLSKIKWLRQQHISVS
jgi:hypothetical protein